MKNQIKRGAFLATKMCFLIKPTDTSDKTEVIDGIGSIKITKETHIFCDSKLYGLSQVRLVKNKNVN